MSQTDLILETLKEHIEVVQCKNNKKAYIAKECPFCKEKGRRVFRYNSKLKVGKFYCCGRSFKELRWLKKQFEDKDFVEKFQIKNRHGWYANDSEEYLKMLEDKLNTPNSGFEKFGEDDPNLPF